MKEFEPKKPDKKGICHYSDSENEMWSVLYCTQLGLLQARACSEFVACLYNLDLGGDAVPQINHVSEKLYKTSGWRMAPVTGVTSFEDFFFMLSRRIFPAATFIRDPKNQGFIGTPDIFHEIFGHAPLLQNLHYAEFSRKIGKLGVGKSKAFQKRLAAIYWFTCETGLVGDPNGTFTAYGASTISSSKEIQYVMEQPPGVIKPFNIGSIIREEYRIDQLPDAYYVIPSLAYLSEISFRDIEKAINREIEDELFLSIARTPLRKPATRAGKENSGVCKAGHTPLSLNAARERMNALEDWKLIEEREPLMLTRTYKFRNYRQAMKFTNRIFDLAENKGHHPELLIEWGKTRVTWYTHSSNGLLEIDYEMAQLTDALFCEVDPGCQMKTV